MQETTCSLCGKAVRATDDDLMPLCITCQGTMAEASLVRSIVQGEMDHTIPELAEDYEDGES